MDQTSPDQATPEQTDEPESKPVPRAPEPATLSAREHRTETRLHAKVGDDVDVWAHGWVSRSTRAHRLFAARTLDFAVLSPDTLTLVSTGFFSRRPRRRVYSAAAADLVVTDDPVPKGRRLRIRAGDGRELWIELGADDRSNAFAAALVDRSRRDSS